MFPALTAPGWALVLSLRTPLSAATHSHPAAGGDAGKWRGLEASSMESTSADQPLCFLFLSCSFPSLGLHGRSWAVQRSPCGTQMRVECVVWCVCTVGISFPWDPDHLLSAEAEPLNFAKLDWSTPVKDPGNRGRVGGISGFRTEENTICH